MTLVNEALLIDNDAEDIALLTNMLPCHFDDTRVGISMQYDIGESYNWSKQHCPVSFVIDVFFNISLVSWFK